MAIVLKVDPKYPDANTIERAVSLVETGRIIVYPTDTIYGVGTNALNSKAVLRIFEVKRRPLDMPFPVAVDSIEMAERLAVVTGYARSLIEAFWPGALTLVLPKKPVVPDTVTAGQRNLALRAPNHVVPLKIIERSNLPLITTSANIHGAPGCKNAQEVLSQLGDRVDLVLDGGPTAGAASTILDLTAEKPRILREGPVTRMMLRQVLGRDIG